jgi:Uma2 family endonuclease
MDPIVNNPAISEDERLRRYGYREVARQLPDGTVVFDRVALTLDDLLHPQLGDVAVESSVHDQERHYLASVFRSQLEDDPKTLVLSDCGVYWDNPELKHHSPDVAVIFNIRSQRENWSSFQVAEEGTRPRLIIEVVSPEYRKNDTVAKVLHYYQAGVAWYVIVDREQEDDPPKLVVRRHQAGGWEEVALNEKGRVWLPMVRVWLGVQDGRVACFDGDTGAMFGDYSAVRRELAEKESRIEFLEAQMEVEIDARREVLARANALETRAKAEAEARRMLEAQVTALQAELAHARGGS